MIKKIILPVLLAGLGTGAGVGAGIYLKAPPTDPVEKASDQKQEVTTKPAEYDETQKEDGGEYDYVKLNNQFVVPIVDDGAVSALVVLSLSVEITAGQKPAVFQREPRLRDGFLQVMFDHANLGGFTGTFTNSNNMNTLRMGLREVAQNILGDTVKDVLITDIVRQDI